LPTSFYHQIPLIIEIVRTLSPRSILDVGVGFGKYGFLLREYMELWDESTKAYGVWNIKIDGIEIYDKYLTPCHKYIYNNIYLGKAQDIVGTIHESYDLVLLIDVIEHLPKQEGYHLVRSLKEIASDILITTPKTFVKQKVVFNNEYEQHKSFWTEKDFKKIAPLIVIPDRLSLIIVMGKNIQLLKHIRRKRFLRNIIPF